MSRMTAEEYAQERECDKINTLGNIEYLLKEILCTLKEMNKK